ncbi:Copia protein, partial [Symbiodinium microadriaticum]
MGGQGLLGEGLEGVLKDCEVGEWDESESADFSQEQVDQSEQKAQELLQQKDFKHKSCEQLLQTLPFLNKSRPRQAHEETKPRYLIFGAYSYGNHYGVTRMTYRMKTTCRYLLTYLQHWSSEKVHCSSLVVNDDCRMMVHRDMNNLPGTLNYVIGVTPFQHGELWLEGHCSDPKAPSLNKKLSSGEYKSGWRKNSSVPFVKNERRMDPDLRKTTLFEIYLDIIPGEAHWQIGTAESAIQGLKTVLNKLSTEDASLTAEQAMSLAVSTFNHREMVRGFSPAQHVLGCAPDETGRQILGDRARQEEIILSQPIEDFQKEAELRATAEKALADWQAQQRISRAANSRTRPQHLYHPGDLVYFWRTQESGKGKRSPGTTQGRFLGPARILAMETRRSESGEVRPTHAIWVVRGRHLMKCSPEQLRPASQREELVESLACSDQTPWTYTRLAEEIGGTQYEDISAEVPTAPEWQRAQDVQAEVQPPRSRIRGKRAAPEQPDDLDLEDPDSQEPSQPSSYQRRDRLDGPKREAPAGALWQDDVRENAWAAEETCFWSSEEAAVAIEIEMPQSNRGWDKFFNNPQSYFVGALRRRAVEVSEKRLSPEDREKFREAKNKEVRNFIAAQAFEALPEHLKPSRTQAIGMRWLLTWKPQDNGSVKAKARAILLGYQDPNYEFRSTTAPVMTRQTRQLFLQAAANRRWRIQKGDITGAFLQGREYPTELFCIPCDEILESMNLPAGSVVRLKRACYGLVDAPLEWYRTVSEFLESIGLTRLWSDACAWVWRPQGVLRGMITGHVDDFLFGGSEEDKGWQEVLRLIKERFKWGDWDQDKFVQCGVLIETTHEGFSLSQPHYLSNLEEIHINAQRRKDRTAETTDWEKTQLRALLGGLSWFAQQTGPHLSAEISMMLSEVTRSNVETIVQANLLLQHAKARKDHKICIFRHKDEDMQFYAWVDAANKNRVGDGSTQGIFIGAAPKQLLRGDVCSISPMSWNSTKIDRSCRSPGSAETQAAVNGEDSLFYMRYQWSEMQYGKVNLRSPSAVVKQTGGCLITDSRNVYDKLSTEVLTVQGAEKKSNLELLSVKESQMATHLIVRWVHSEAQLANALTKKGAKELELFYKMRFMWRIVEEEPEPAQREQAEVVLALDALSKLTHDYEVLRDAVRSHEEALTEVLEEIEYLSPQAQQLPRARNQTKELQQCLSDACSHGEAMLRSKAQSSSRLAELCAIFPDSISAEGDVQREALIDGMAAENAALWRMVRLSEVAESRGPIPFVAPPLKFPPAARGRRQARRRPVTEESSQASPELPPVPPSSPEDNEEAVAPPSTEPTEMQEQETGEFCFRARFCELRLNYSTPPRVYLLWTLVCMRCSIELPNPEPYVPSLQFSTEPTSRMVQSHVHMALGPLTILLVAMAWQQWAGMGPGRQPKASFTRSLSMIQLKPELNKQEAEMEQTPYNPVALQKRMPGAGASTTTARTACPHEEPGLLPFSDFLASQDGSGDLTLSGGSYVLSESCSLGSLTIAPGAELVVSDIAGLSLETRAIYVQGTLRMGSASCPL